MQHADRGGNSVSASVTGCDCNVLDRANIALSCVFIARTNRTEEDNGAITALHHGQFTRVTLIRGKTNDRGPPRPPTEAETFLIISRLMKPRAVRMILVHASAYKRVRERESVYVCVRGERERRESMCRRAIAFGCFELRRVTDRPDASFSTPPAGTLRRFWQISTAVYALSYVPE